MNTANSILLSPADNVAVANGRIEIGAVLPGGAVATALIEPGHKVAIKPIAVGEAVVKYAQAIGRATEAIAPGEHVHSHNLVFESGRLPVVPPSEAVHATEADRARTFMGYRRADGRAGTRNFVGILASVNCSATVCHAIADEANRTLLPRYPGIDGFVPIVHGQGCGMSATGEGMMVLHRTLAGYARHPNFGGVLMVGLGCEVNQLTLYGQKGVAAGKRHFNIQEAGGSRKSVEKALVVLAEISEEVGKLEREPIPVSEIVVGLQCGGSDGMSGITANPALGAAVDILAGVGGIGILSETTEIYGAEHLLAGQTPLNGVFGYAEKVSGHGLVFMDTPGYDPVSATGQVAGGANVIVFTTGRGSCFGCRPTPSIKVASNSTMYHTMEEDMDVNCGVIASGEKTIAGMGREIFELIVETASGRKTKSEEFGYGDNEFVPWHLGATL
ncbi:MAG: altronate dehydratase [Mesorhizobium sp.]|nr:MAG: altronate dehydratase [Mesorhizobium sp.]